MPPWLVEWYAAGKITGDDVARALGVSNPTALKRLRAAGVDTARNKGGRQTNSVIVPATVRAAYARGEIGIRDVAGLCGCSFEAARKALRRAGVKIWTRAAIVTPPPQAAKHLRTLLRWLRENGWQRRDLADIIGVSGEMVRRLSQ